MRPIDLARAGMDDGVRWYPDATASALALGAVVGVSLPTMADIIAVTSPRVPVKRNVMLAAQYAATGSMEGMLPSVQVALQHWERTGEIRGPKTSAFAAAIAGDTAAVVIDTWMRQALALERLTARTIRQAQATVRAIATRLGATPRATQAAIWLAYRAAQGHHNRAMMSQYVTEAHTLYMTGHPSE